MDESSVSQPGSVSPKVACALALARQHPAELVHLEQVARLSVVLFDGLKPLHRLVLGERDLLCCAALLHDIGISVGYKGHHKSSRKLIEGADLPALTTCERSIVAQLARYHRKAAPSEKHRAYRELDPDSQRRVLRLAPILRIADGLDRAHQNAVARVEIVLPDPGGACRIDLFGPGDLDYAAWGARRKAGLFAEVYGVDVSFEPKGPVID